MVGGYKVENMKEYNKYNKGSEWRRWDLHFHTQSSYDYKDKSATNQDIIDGLVQNNVSVVAITDHHVMDVERIQNLQLLGRDKVTVLPAIEFLSDSKGSDPIHFIGIFSENCNLQFIWEQIKNKTAISRIEGEGKKINEVYCDLFETVKLIHDLGGIVTIHAGSKSNTIDNITNSLEHGIAQKEDIAKAIDIFELGKEEDITPYYTMVNPFLEKKINKVLPLIICSDNHNIKEYKVKQNLWIKADPTFEGLKQVLYEPKGRVHIGEDKPDDKLLYHVIDKVKFQDDSFTTNEIEINQNLTAIIGGKSTGKSILLKNIAKSIDIEEYNKRLKTAGLQDSKPIKGMEVYWKDGQVSKLDSETNPNKRIIYIPQSYLNRVVDNEKENTDIDDIIKEVLLQDDDFSEWFSLLSLKEKAINDNIENAIKSLYDNLSIYRENNTELKKIGDEKGVNEQIKKITQEIKDIQSKLNLKQEDIDAFNVQIEKIKKEKLEIEFLQEDIKSLNQLKEVKISIYNSFEFTFKSEAISDDIDKITTSKTQIYSADWKKEVEGLITKHSDKLQELIANNQKAITDLKPLQEKVDSQKNLTKKYKELEEEQKKQQIIQNLKKKKTDARSAIDELTKKLSEYTAEYYSIYLEAKDKIKLDNLDDELEFDIKTEFRDTHFYESFIRTFFDGRKINKAEYDYLTKYEFSSKETFKELIHKVIWEILKGNLPLRNPEATREVITGLLKNWFIHNYKVEYQGDQINDMSPGKKSFVLLRLLVDLDNSKCPILIDQPEDDLDNRSIYNQVVHFLRKRKSERQIIIATHNPNLVLGADAEQVIVANQEGKGTKNKSSMFEYVSGAIEHTFIEDDSIEEVLYRRGIQEHICDVLEGGEEAFNKRKNKYNFA